MITVQLGNYSNFVGAQIFNLQNPETQAQDPSNPERPTPNILWTETKKSFSPRVVIFDTKENVAVGPPSYSDSQNKNPKNYPALWDGKLETIVDDGDAKPINNQHGTSWNERINWRLNPEKIHLLPNFTHNSETGQLSSYSQGLEVWKLMEERAEDNLRKYAEDCDHLQGFNILADQLDGYSGVATGLLLSISDNYNKKLCIGIGLCPPTLPPTTETGKERSFRTRMTNTTMLWNAFNSHSSVFTSLGLCEDFTAVDLIPKGIPYLNYKVDSFYESSGIIAATLDTLFSPCISSVQTRHSIPIAELASFLSAYDRKLTSISSSFPFPLDFKNTSLFSALNTNGLSPLINLTPGLKLELDNASGNYFALRGVNPINAVSDKERQRLSNSRITMKDAESCFETFVNETFSKGINLVRGLDTPLTITDPFPCSVVEEYAKTNFSTATRYSNGFINSWSLASLASAQNSKDTGTLLDKVLVEAKGGKRSGSTITQTLPSVNELGMEVDDFLDSLNNLQDLKNIYQEKA